jgi:hypothetical protein
LEQAAAVPVGPGLAWRRALPLAALLSALLAWGCAFIARSSFVVEGRRVFCLFDDAMISMTYARNLCDGLGLNWARQGAPVEGFSHPLWLLPMIAVNAAGLPLALRSLPIQLLSLLLLLANVVLVRTLVLRHFSWPGARHWLLAAVLTAFCYPLGYWSLMGMETALQALLTTAAVLLALDIVSAGRRRHLALWAVLTGACLLRLDMAVVAAAVEGFVLAAGGLRWRDDGARRDRREWLAGATLFAGTAFAYEVFRWSYFHDWLPNTWYLKMTGVPAAVRLLRGGLSLWHTAVEHAALFAAVAAGCLTVLRRERRMLLPALVFLASCAYSVYVGGDAWDDDMRLGRFVAFAMPMVFVLLGGAVNRILALLYCPRAAGGLRAPTANLALEEPAAFSCAPASAAFPNGVPGAAALGTAAPGYGAAIPAATGTPAAAPPGAVATLAFAPRAATLRAAADAPRRRPVRALALGANLVLWMILANGLVLAPRAARNREELALARPPYLVPAHRIFVEQLLAVRRVAAPDAEMASAVAGIPAFFTDFRMIDLLGYNDRALAHGPAVERYTPANFAQFRPGHTKWDTREVLAERRPDIVFMTWGIPADRVPRVMHRHGYVEFGRIWVRAGSDKVAVAAGGSWR